MIDDAIASLRTLFTASLAVLVVWLVAWPATREKLSLFSGAAELHEWVALKDRIGRLERNVLDTPAGQEVTEDAENADIVVSILWPERRSYAISLEPVFFESTSTSDVVRAYRLAGRDLPASWNRVYAVFHRVDPEREPDTSGVLDEEPHGVEVGLVPVDYPGFQVPRPGERQILAALREANFPASWEELRLPLLEHGFDGDASALTRDDAALAGLRGAVDVRKESAGIALLGVRLSLSQLFAAIGLVLAVQAFLALGPLLALRAAEERTTKLSWIFVLPAGDDVAHRVLEPAICAATLAWAAAPLGILVLQCLSYARLGSMPHWSFWPGALGLVGSALVFARIALELRVLRTAGAAYEREPQGAAGSQARGVSLNPR